MNYGNVNNNGKTNSNYVWPVRGGEWCLPLSRGDSERLYSFENLYRCYLDCRKRKRNTVNALRFEINAEENLLKLSEELCSRTYTPSRSVCFVVERPKMREIVAADFRDRVVHHVLVGALQPMYERIFIHDSYACRDRKGTHKAIERVKEFIRKGSANGNKRLHFMHLDIRNFFMTMDKNVLYGMLEKKIASKQSPAKQPPVSPFSKGEYESLSSFPLNKGGAGGCAFVLWLAQTIIFHNPVSNCIVKGQLELFKQLPPHKSLFHAPENKGLPVGNLTSQFFANVYLNELDQFVKHTLKCRYYVRYCDDFLILDESPERLIEVKERIDGFVQDRLKLTLNDKFMSIAPVTNGIDFLGYVIHPDHTLARRRVVNNLRTKLEWFEKRLTNNPTRPPLNLRGGVEGLVLYDYPLLEKLRAVLASYWGHLKWADTYNLKSAIIRRYSFISEYFKVDDSGITPLYKYRQDFPLVRFQYLYYAGIFSGAIVFFQVGGFYEFYEEVKMVSLKAIKKNGRGVKFGFPVKLEQRYLKQFLNSGMAVVIVKETDRYFGRLKERLPVMKINAG